MQNAENLPQESGIYKITNLLNGHCYIGQSVNIYRRYHSHHKVEYKNEKVSHYPLYLAFSKYGLENFKIEVLELCESSLLNEKEKYWISYFDSFKNGYNATEGGQSWSENIYSQETKLKRLQTLEKNKSLQGENHPRAKLSNEEVILIRSRYQNGESVSDIYKDYCEIYNSIDVFRRIVLGNTYQKVDFVLDKEDIRYTNAKLSKEQVIDLRRRYYIENESLPSLAKEFNVSAATAGRIARRETYAHIQDNFPNQRKRKTYRLTPDEVREIRKLSSEGVSVSTLADKYSINQTAIRKCIQRITYSNID